jgi:hypothetical protein
VIAAQTRLLAGAALAAVTLSACASSSDPPAPPPPVACTAGGIPGTCRADCGAYDSGTAGVCSAGLLCCTPALAVACDSSAMPLPNAGLAEEAGDTGCPAGMARVAATPTFCVDRYEAALVVAATGQPWSPYWFPGATAVRAVSLRNAVPQACVNGTQAAAACAAAGKRLCTDAEWLRACQGPGGTTYPYGSAYVAGNCNDTRAVHPAVELFGTTDAWMWNFLDHPCLDQLPASLGRTRDRTACVTAEGVYDMVGNLAERTADPAGTLRGGDYVSAALNLNGFGCANAATAHNVGYHDYTTGFRCCADAP